MPNKHKCGGKPGRDSRGRFLKGRSGNYGGRPRKPKPTQLSHGEALQWELAQEITVNGPEGPTRRTKREVLIASAVNDALRATGKERWWILDRLSKMGALDPTDDDDNDVGVSVWTAIERQWIHDVSREIGVDTKGRRWNIALGCWEPEE